MRLAGFDDACGHTGPTTVGALDGETGVSGSDGSHTPNP
jgi:hypothetical protein